MLKYVEIIAQATTNETKKFIMEMLRRDMEIMNGDAFVRNRIRGTKSPRIHKPLASNQWQKQHCQYPAFMQEIMIRIFDHLNLIKKSLSKAAITANYLLPHEPILRFYARAFIC